MGLRFKVATATPLLSSPFGTSPNSGFAPLPHSRLWRGSATAQSRRYVMYFAAKTIKTQLIYWYNGVWFSAPYFFLPQSRQIVLGICVNKNVCRCRVKMTFLYALFYRTLSRRASKSASISEASL